MVNKNNSTRRQLSLPSFCSLKRISIPMQSSTATSHLATMSAKSKYAKPKKHSPYNFRDSKSHPYSYQNPKYRAELLSQLYAIVDSDGDEVNTDEDEGYISA